MDEGGGYAISRWAFAEGGEFSVCPGVAQSEPREEDTGPIDSDNLNMRPGT
jgi:hypothetical protein